MLNSFWNSPKLEKAAIKLSRFTSFVYLLFGGLLLIFELNGFGDTWHKR